jgi:hypothetical protein
MQMNSRLRGVILGSAMVVIFITGIVIGQNKFGQPKSVIHVVTLKWKAGSTPEQRQKALDGVKTMAAEMPGIKNVWLKTLKVQGPSAELVFDAAFVMEFADEAAFKAYATHPSHKKWEEVYLPLRESSRTHDITN